MKADDILFAPIIPAKQELVKFRVFPIVLEPRIIILEKQIAEYRALFATPQTNPYLDPYSRRHDRATWLDFCALLKEWKILNGIMEAEISANDTASE